VTAALSVPHELLAKIQVGPMTLSHRVVMAPLTRSRSKQPGDIPNDLMREYYTQRASERGLIISEATSISIAGRGWFGAPGLYSDEQVAGWKKITGAVHARGGRMYSQLWHTGRSSHVEMTEGAMPHLHDSPFNYNDCLHADLTRASASRVGCRCSATRFQNEPTKEASHKSVSGHL
jgi:2,4-dienoyl-CoA reductase-like NADH-dependent reductase (Old Yellow Enzyme family)